MTLISLSCTTANMSSTQSIITHIQKSQKSILRMFFVILVHRSMYMYHVLGTYMYVPTARHVLFRECTRVEVHGYHNIHVPYAQNSFPQSVITCLPSRVLGKLCTDPFVPVCTSTYSFRSHSHFIFNQARPSLQRPRVSFLQTSNALLAASCLSKVSSIVRPPRRGLPRPNCHSHVLNL